MVISIDADKYFNKIQVNTHLWKTNKQTLQKVGIEAKYLNILKAIYNKPKANIIPLFCANIIINTEKLKALSLRSGTRQGCPPSSLLLNIVLQVLNMAIREGGEKKRK